MMRYDKHIANLEKRHSETNIGKDEALFPDTISKINQTYNKNQQKRRVDAILNNVRNKDSIKEEVHEIIGDVKLKTLCYNCSEEQIIAIIILYVQRTRNPKYRIDRTRFWKEYEITWLKYSLILERLLRFTREKTPVKIKQVERFDDPIIRR